MMQLDMAIKISQTELLYGNNLKSAKQVAFETAFITKLIRFYFKKIMT